MDGLNNTLSNTQSDDLQVVTSEAKDVTPTFDKFKSPSNESLALGESPKKHSNKKSFYKRPWFVILSVVLVVMVGIFAWIGMAAYQTTAKLKDVQSHAMAVSEAFTTRDLARAESELTATKEALSRAHATYNQTAPLRIVWPIGAYLKDGERVFVSAEKATTVGDLIIAAIKPYADLMGFSGTEAGDLNLATAEDRIIFVAETVEKLAPEMDKINAILKEIDTEIQGINENRYPKTLAGREVRSKITQAKSTVSALAGSLQNFQPIVKLLPDLLGNPDPRKYLILFQNDAELRPTGGFLTAYATLTITKGKIEPGISEDIYTLDNGFKRKVPAPEPIKKYLPLVYNWNLRDMNLSPDFKTSMDTFTTYMKESSVAPEYDAIIAIDTEVPVRILKVLGPIGVSGYGGKFSAENDPRCDCPQVIYELENIITKPTYEIREGRKSILGPLMNSMLANMMGSPKAKWAEFFNIFTESIEQKHLLMYFKDENKQHAAEVLGSAGRILSYDGDYLHINDTNFAGAKSNLFVESEVTQDVNINDDGSATKKLVITYKNPRKGDNCNLEAGLLCLNGILRDWIRLYVPKGSVLKAGRGFEADMITSEDLGYTVLEGFFTLSPQSVKKLEVEYTIPAGTVDGDYKLLIQKQPGVDPVKHTITVTGVKPKVQVIDSDSEIIIAR
jgi:hypothetical protein